MHFSIRWEKTVTDFSLGLFDFDLPFDVYQDEYLIQMKVVGGWTNVIMHKITSSGPNWQAASIPAVNDEAYFHSIRGDQIFVKFLF